MPIPVMTVRIPAALRCWIDQTIRKAGVGQYGRPLTRADVILAALQAFRESGRNSTMEHSDESADELRRLARDGANPFAGAE